MNNKSFHNLWGAAKSHFLSSHTNEKRTMLVITENRIAYENTLNELKLFFPQKEIFEFPEYSQEPFEQARILPDILSKRSNTLLNLTTGKCDIVITTFYGLLKSLPPVSIFKSSILSPSIGAEYDREELIFYLDFLGYVNVEIVSGKGEFSVRGDILDIFPIDHLYPVRIELFDDEIDSIYEYNPDTQIKIKSLKQFSLIPASELLVDIDEFEKSAKNKNLKEHISNFGKFAGYHWFAPNVYNKMANLLDYIGDIPETIIISDDMNYFLKQWEIRIADSIDQTSFEINTESNFINATTIFKILGKSGITFLKEINDPDSIAENYNSIKTILTSTKSNVYESLERCLITVNDLLQENFKVILAIESVKFKKLIEDYFRDYEISPVLVDKIPQLRGCYFYAQTVSGGFIHRKSKTAIITANEIFGFSRKNSNKKKKDVFKTSLSDLSPDDFVVHIDYGIGKFLGLSHKVIGGIEGDFIEIEYTNQEILYVPVESINQIQKYIGSQAQTPRTDSLQSAKWSKIKQQAYKSAKKVAFDILKLYAERKNKKGFALKGDLSIVKTLENSFEYDETEDQLTAILDVYDDMEQPRPMERLICGDVGFGKTEVAIRASVKAVSSGKQVAVLVPTTVLARQHYETFLKRFSELPIIIDTVSRFKTTSEIKKILQKVEDGQIDILIGTHRLLSKDVVFNDLGLLIVDEEQRFGVTHKEKIKTLRTNIDVLSMSATPIPRTLQMSLAGLRDISIIETPPADRLPVLTRVINDDDQIKHAIEVELKRGGQVYFLHNNVKDIESIAAHIQTLVPLARIRIAHGQMTAIKMEEVLVDFYTGKIDVLVCTTIIENGLDIPNANTIIMNNAHTFGLSQMYQIKGRVGRSDRRGHCFLIVRSFNSLGDLAQKRLKIIQQLSDLGSGFKIATYDLQLRGAGDLLGADQSGFAVQVGYELYMQLIEQAVNELKGGQNMISDTEINSSIPYYLPAEYIVNSSYRIDYYNRIADIKTIADKDLLQDELEESYGTLPNASINLLNIMLIKNLARMIHVKKVLIMSSTIKLTFDTTTELDPVYLLNIIKESKLSAVFKSDYELQLSSPKDINLMFETINLLQAIKRGICEQ